MWNWLDTPKERTMEIAIGVANTFVQLGIDHGNPVDRWKLQILMLVAHGWYLVTNNEPLVDENFVAESKGPIIRSVHSRFRKFGDGPITSVYATSVIDRDDNIKKVVLYVDSKGDDAGSVIRSVWSKYESETYQDLYDHMISVKTFPWTHVWQQQSNYGKENTYISDKLIEEFFKPMVQR